MAASTGGAKATRNVLASLEKDLSVRDAYDAAKGAGKFSEYRDERWFKLSAMTRPPGVQLKVRIPGDQAWMDQLAAHEAGPPLPGMSTPEPPPMPEYLPNEATAEAVYLATLAGDAEAVSMALSETRTKFEEAVERELVGGGGGDGGDEAAGGGAGGDEGADGNGEALDAARIAVRKRLGWGITDCHNGLCVLSHAGAKARLEVVQALLAAGASVVSRSTDGRAALHCAAEWRGLPHAQQQLISRIEILTGRPPPLAKQPDAPVSDEQAAQAAGVVEALVAHGADVKAAAHDGTTPLHVCGRDGRSPAVLKTLLTAGADPTCRDELGVTPLMAACSGGEAAIVEAMLEQVRQGALAAAAAEVEQSEAAGEAADDEAAPSGAAERKATRAVKLAMAMADSVGMQPLHHAIDGGHSAVAMLLVERGAAVCATTKGQRPLKKLHPLAARTLLRQVRERQVEMGVSAGEPTYSEYGSIGSRPSTAHAQQA